MLKKTIVIFLLIAILCSLGILLKIFVDDNGLLNITPSYEKLELIGTYTLNSETHPLTDDFSELSDRNNILINAHFSRDIPKNALIYLRIDNLAVLLRINGGEIYSFGKEGTLPYYAKSAGNTWGNFVSPGITVTDEISIELSNVYANHATFSIKAFTNNIILDLKNDFAICEMRSGFFNTFYSIMVICLGIIILIVAATLIKMRELFFEALLLSGFAIMSGIWFFIDFNVIGFYTQSGVFVNSLDIVSIGLSSAFVFTYMAWHLKNKLNFLLYGLSAAFSFFLILASVLQITGAYDYYALGNIIFLLLGIGFIFAVIVSIYEVWRVKSEASWMLLISVLILFAGAGADLLFYFMGLIEYTLWFKASFFVFLILQTIRFSKMIESLVSEKTRAELLQGIAYTDVLTGIGNRAAYRKSAAEINGSENICISGIAVLDINGLKKVNDEFGHDSGDALIISAAEVIAKTFRKGCVFRIGGDEFIAILNDDEKLNAAFLNTLERLVREHNSSHKDRPNLSIACGAAWFDSSTDKTLDDIFVRADAMMYERKNTMKSRNIS
ncbi:MAG: GGDEF domain-containing protein [Clostridia bacterium]